MPPCDDWTNALRRSAAKCKSPKNDHRSTGWWSGGKGNWLRSRGWSIVGQEYWCGTWRVNVKDSYKENRYWTIGERGIRLEEASVAEDRYNCLAGRSL